MTFPVAHLSSHGATCSWHISWALMISVFLRSPGLTSSTTVSYLLHSAVFWSSPAAWLSLLDGSVKAVLLFLWLSGGSEDWAQELNSVPRVNIRHVPSVANRAALFLKREMINRLAQRNHTHYRELKGVRQVHACIGGNLKGPPVLYIPFWGYIILTKWMFRIYKHFCIVTVFRTITIKE